MSEQAKPKDERLVPAGRNELAPVAAVNALVNRGLADLARIQTEQDSNVEVAPATPGTPSTDELLCLLAKMRSENYLKIQRLRLLEARCKRINLLGEKTDEYLLQSLDKMDSRGAIVLRMRWGLIEGENAKTTEQIAESLGLTPEGVNAIESEALNKLCGLLKVSTGNAPP